MSSKAPERVMALPPDWEEPDPRQPYFDVQDFWNEYKNTNRSWSGDVTKKILKQILQTVGVHHDFADQYTKQFFKRDPRIVGKLTINLGQPESWENGNENAEGGPFVTVSTVPVANFLQEYVRSQVFHICKTYRMAVEDNHFVTRKIVLDSLSERIGSRTAHDIMKQFFRWEVSPWKNTVRPIKALGPYGVVKPQGPVEWEDREVTIPDLDAWYHHTQQEAQAARRKAAQGIHTKIHGHGGAIEEHDGSRSSSRSFNQTTTMSEAESYYTEVSPSRRPSPSPIPAKVAALPKTLDIPKSSSRSVTSAASNFSTGSAGSMATGVPELRDSGVLGQLNPGSWIAPPPLPPHANGKPRVRLLPVIRIEINYKEIQANPEDYPLNVHPSLIKPKEHECIYFTHDFNTGPLTKKIVRAALPDAKKDLKNVIMLGLQGSTKFHGQNVFIKKKTPASGHSNLKSKNRPPSPLKAVTFPNHNGTASTIHPNPRSNAISSLCSNNPSPSRSPAPVKMPAIKTSTLPKSRPSTKHKSRPEEDRGPGPPTHGDEDCSPFYISVLTFHNNEIHYNEITTPFLHHGVTYSLVCDCSQKLALNRMDVIEKRRYTEKFQQMDAVHGGTGKLEAEEVVEYYKKAQAEQYQLFKEMYGSEIERIKVLMEQMTLQNDVIIELVLRRVEGGKKTLTLDDFLVIICQAHHIITNPSDATPPASYPYHTLISTTNPRKDLVSPVKKPATPASEAQSRPSTSKSGRKSPKKGDK